MVGISADRLDSYPHQLSGGMRQRVMIAVAIALRPTLLIMDEPTTALDVVIQREILEELMDLRERLGFSVLFITHDLSLLIEIADTIAVMYAGKLIEKGPAKAVFRAPRHPYTYGLTRLLPVAARREEGHDRHRGVAAGPAQVPSGCPFHPRCAWAIGICTTRSRRRRAARCRRWPRGPVLAARRRPRRCPSSSRCTPPAAGTLAVPAQHAGVGTRPNSLDPSTAIEGGSAL